MSDCEEPRAYAEAIAWLRDERSMANAIPNDVNDQTGIWPVRIAQGDAAMMQRAYWMAKAYEDLEGLKRRIHWTKLPLIASGDEWPEWHCYAFPGAYADNDELAEIHGEMLTWLRALKAGDYRNEDYDVCARTAIGLLSAGVLSDEQIVERIDWNGIDEADPKPSEGADE